MRLAHPIHWSRPPSRRPAPERRGLPWSLILNVALGLSLAALVYGGVEMVLEAIDLTARIREARL